MRSKRSAAAPIPPANATGRAFPELVDAVPPCPASTPPTGSSSASATVFATGVAGSGNGAKVTGGRVTGAMAVAIVDVGVKGVVDTDDSAVLDGVTAVAVGSDEPATVVAVRGGNVVTPIPRTVVVVTAGRREAPVADVVVVCADAAFAAPRNESAESAPTITTDFRRLLGDFARCAEFDW